METKTAGANIIATILKVVILIVVGITALSQIGIDISFAESSFLIVLAGIMLAIGLGFGLAMKEDAKTAIKAIRKKL